MAFGRPLQQEALRKGRRGCWEQVQVVTSSVTGWPRAVGVESVLSSKSRAFPRAGPRRDLLRKSEAQAPKVEIYVFAEIYIYF